MNENELSLVYKHPFPVEDSAFEKVYAKIRNHYFNYLIWEIESVYQTFKGVCVEDGVVTKEEVDELPNGEDDVRDIADQLIHICCCVLCSYFTTLTMEEINERFGYLRGYEFAGESQDN